MDLLQNYQNDNTSTSSEEESKEMENLLGIQKINPNPEVALAIPSSDLVNPLNKVSKKSIKF